MNGRLTIKLLLSGTLLQPACTTKTTKQWPARMQSGLSISMLDGERHEAMVVACAAQNTFCCLANLNILGLCQHAVRLDMLQEFCIQPLRAKICLWSSGRDALIPGRAHL